MDEWGVKKADDTQYSPEPGTLQGVFTVTLQHHVGDKNKPEDQGEGQLSVPHPPGAPDGFRPDGAGEKHERAEEETDFGGARSPYVPPFFPSNEIQNAEDENEEKGGVHREGRRHVKIEYFLGEAHLPFHACVHEGKVGRNQHANQRQDAEDTGPKVQPFPHITPRSHNRTKARRPPRTAARMHRRC